MELSPKQEKQFAKGIYAKRNENAPDFVVCNVSVKVDDFYEFAKANCNKMGYINLDLKKSKEAGKFYFQVNNFEPKKQDETPAQPIDADFPF